MKHYFALTLFATLFVACTNETPVPLTDQLAGKPIQIKTNISKLIESRVEGNDKVENLNKFTLFIDGGTDGTNYYAMMVRENSNWKSFDPNNNKPPYTPLTMTWTNSNPVNVSAYYCADEIFDYMSASTIMSTVLEHQATKENFKKSDQLYMPSAEITPDNEGVISIDFKHRFAKIKISINTNSTETENIIQDLHVNGTATSRLYTPKTNTWGDIEEENIKDITACLDSYENGKAVYEAIIIPQEIAAHKFKITIKIADSTCQWSLQEAITFEEGKQYTFDLQLNKKEEDLNTISVSSVNITTWNETTTTITGSILY